MKLQWFGQKKRISAYRRQKMVYNMTVNRVIGGDMYLKKKRNKHVECKVCRYRIGFNLLKHVYSHMENVKLFKCIICDEDVLLLKSEHAKKMIKLVRVEAEKEKKAEEKKNERRNCCYKRVHFEDDEGNWREGG
uniref:C2H2-type domain-containing protein n=1 Tax=Meloidogyne hapla TaxID=6305 RepID=A0A1I8BH89_MELHA